MSLEEHLRALSLFASGATGPEGICALLAEPVTLGRRPFVYRNSGMLACMDALRSNYPRLRVTMGDEAFTGLARAFTTYNPPVMRTLVGFGATLPDFILNTDQGRAQPWWSDLARLDRAWLQAHLATDDHPVTPMKIALISGDGEALPALRLKLRASVHIVRTDWMVFDIWEKALASLIDCAPVHHGEEAVLVWRPAMDVEARRITEAEAGFLGACAAGVTLGEAFLAAESADATMNVSTIFASALMADIFAAGAVGAPE